MHEVIECLIDWLNREPSDEKPHRILRALATESLKKAGFDESKRRFTAEEIAAAAVGFPGNTDAKKWIDWTESFMKYWDIKEPQIIEFARQRDLQVYPKPVRNSPKGGPGNFTTFFIRALPLPAIIEEEIADEMLPDGRIIKCQVRYEIVADGDVKPSWLAKWLFYDGQVQLKSWHVWLILGWLLLVGGFSVLISYFGWLVLATPNPVTTRELTTLITIFGLPYLVWISVLRPWVHLFDDRIVLAHEIFINIKEKSAQFELLRDGDLRQIRLVRYSATCPICGATIYLENGAPDYPRRLVGRCYESPREHVFSFDRVTRRGRILVEQ